MRTSTVAIFALAIARVGTAAPEQEHRGPMPYPEARIGRDADVFHGVTVRDPYRWLEALESAETAAWVEAQNRFAATHLAAAGAGTTALRARLAELGDAWPDFEVPVVVGERHFLLGLDPATRSHSALFTRQGAGGEPRLLLDPVQRDARATLTAFVPSPDGERVAVTIGQGGTDWGEIHVLDVASTTWHEQPLRGIRFSGSVHWTADGAGFLYRRFAMPEGQALDAPARDAAIYRHRLGSPQSADLLVHAIAAADAADKSLDIALSEDRRRLFLSLERGPWLHFLGGSARQVSTVEISADGVPAGTAGWVPLTIHPAAYRVVATDGNRLYLMTDLDAPRRRLVSFDLTSATSEPWQTVIPEAAGVLQSVHHFGGRFVAMYLEDVHSVLRVFDRGGRPLGAIALPDIGTVQALKGHPGDPSFRFLFTSFLTPPILLRHDLDTGATVVEGRGRVAVDTSAFVTEQVWFPSKDGTRVPMFVMFRRGLVRDGSHPTILFGYGASGDSMLPGFSEDAFAWLEMGGVYAVANVRGGGELGKSWYEAAIRERKQTSFDDFIAAAEHLVTAGFTSPARLAIRGASNGGLLVTAAMTQRPDLFAVALADVPVTDALRRDRSGTGRVQTDQWGTTDDPVQFRAMFAYSPLHNVATKGCYPATLVTTARNDDRLPPWHAFKFVAALQAAQTCDNPILLRVRGSGGHSGSDDLDAMFDEMAIALMFAGSELGRPGLASHPRP
jgi:prolyl oligopeptidase